MKIEITEHQARVLLVDDVIQRLKENPDYQAKPEEEWKYFLKEGCWLIEGNLGLVIGDNEKFYLEEVA